MPGAHTKYEATARESPRRNRGDSIAGPSAYGGPRSNAAILLYTYKERSQTLKPPPHWLHHLNTSIFCAPSTPYRDIQNRTNMNLNAIPYPSKSGVE